jgi:acetyl esterase/lipase
MNAPRRVLACLAAFLPLAGCSATGLATALTPAGGVVATRGIPYGPGARRRLDLYQSEGLTPRAPLLVFFYGGGWRSGARDDYPFVARPLAQLGALVAVPDYRLWPDTTWPGFIEDGAAALRELAEREPTRPLVLMGHSAGAFIAASLALDPRWGVRPRVAGFIGLAGPYDFGSDEVSPPAIFGERPRVMAAPPEVDLHGAPRLLLLHGAADVTVGPYHSRILARRGREAGVPVRHVEYPGVSHVGIVAALAAPVRALGLAGADVLGDVAEFLAETT